jgi:hypothetical protein
MSDLQSLVLMVEIAVAKWQLLSAKEREPGKSACPFRGPDRSRPAERDDIEESELY